jgi:hypothetical protein
MKTFIALLLAIAAFPAKAGAQGGFYLVPSVSVAEVSDTYVFSSPSASDSDLVLRTSPDIRGGYRSPLLLLSAGYTCDAEQSRTHPDLSNFFVRQKADVNLRYTLGPAATFSTVASYVATHTPGEFNDQTGLIVQRAPATFYSVAPSFRYQLNALTHASAGFEFERMDASAQIAVAPLIAGAPALPLRDVAGSIVTRGINLGLDRRVSGTDVGLARYQERTYDFGGAPQFAGSVTSRAVLLGWTHNFTQLTQITMLAGPRLSDGLIVPEWSAGVRHRLEFGEVALNAERTERVALGQAGTIDVQGLSASVITRLAPRLDLRVKPGVSRDKAHITPLQVTVYSVTVAATRAFSPWFSIEASYRGAWERGDIPPLGPLAFSHTVFAIRAIASSSGWPKALVPRAVPLSE